MLRVLNNFRGIQLAHGCRVTDLEFADDIILLGEGSATVQPVLDRIVLKTNSMTVGLEVKIHQKQSSQLHEARHLASPPMTILWNG